MDQGEQADRLLGALSYGFGWLSAIYFVNTPRRPIRWHALQSIVVFGGLMLSIIAADAIFPLDTRSPLIYQLHVLSMGGLIFISIGLWIALPLMTYLGKPFLVPVFAPLTLKIAGEPPWKQPYEPWDPTGASTPPGQSSPPPAWGGSSGKTAGPCGACAGSGRSTCPSCGGRGSWWDQPTTATGSPQLQTCSYCTGSGRVQCMSCGGSGHTQALI